jgi:CheY-like chemotaxis protein
VHSPKSPTNLLIVEDDVELRKTLASLFEDLDYTVAAAANGQEALFYLQSAPAPCLILLDLIMPVMNGWAFRSEQLDDPRLAVIPVVIISIINVTQEQGAVLNAVAYLGKPVDLTELVVLVAHYCH